MSAPRRLFPEVSASRALCCSAVSLEANTASTANVPADRSVRPPYSRGGDVPGYMRYV